MIPNYGGAPSILAGLVDAAVAKMPPRPAAEPQTSDQGFGQGTGLTGGGLLAGIGNLLSNLLGFGGNP